MRIETLGGTQTAALRLIGELDAATAGMLVADAEPLLLAGHRYVILDCQQLTFCDSHGLRAMNTLADRVRPDGSVTIAHPSDTLNRIFERTDLGANFQIVGPHR